MPAVYTLKQSDIRSLSRFYDSRFKRYGYDPRSLGWVLGSQQIRFKALAAIGSLKGCSILDVGCGFGDLYGYLLASDVSVKYTGVDLNPDFIKIARQTYPDADFIVADFEEGNIKGKFDWSFESGIFNLKLADNTNMIHNTLQKMFKMSKKGVAADFLDAGTGLKDSTMHYADPAELAAFCGTLTKRYTIKSDYRPAEFCVYLYRDRPLE